ncbi:T9SS type A sorting domain-containing protein [Candidatus Acetothermia bacterium]|nr:T9SS type A sorting domain-containing protein [Candidatus Acetothermia bacterium]
MAYWGQSVLACQPIPFSKERAALSIQFKQFGGQLTKQSQISKVLSHLQTTPKKPLFIIRLTSQKAIRLLNKFEAGMIKWSQGMEKLLEKMKEAGTILASDATVLERELDTAKELIDGLIADLSKSPPVLASLSNFAEAADALRYVRHFFRGKSPSCGVNLTTEMAINSPIPIFTLQGQLVANGVDERALAFIVDRLSNGVYLAVRSYDGGRREIVKVALIR